MRRMLGAAEAQKCGERRPGPQMLFCGARQCAGGSGRGEACGAVGATPGASPPDRRTTLTVSISSHTYTETVTHSAVPSRLDDSTTEHVLFSKKHTRAVSPHMLAVCLSPRPGTARAAYALCDIRPPSRRLLPSALLPALHEMTHHHAARWKNQIGKARRRARILPCLLAGLAHRVVPSSTDCAWQV